MRRIPFFVLTTIWFMVTSTNFLGCVPLLDPAAAKDNFIMRWESHAPEPGKKEKAEECYRLEITMDGQLWYGKCGQKLHLDKSVWRKAAIKNLVSQFTSFEYRSADCTLSFHGKGKVTGDLWQRSIAAWAEYEFSELYTGHVCAACRNVLEWSFAVPDQEGHRGMLLVTIEGFGARLLVAADKGFKEKTESIIEGWLTTEEWAQLDQWIRTRSFQGYQGSDALCRQVHCSFDGCGTIKMTPSEFDALGEWARKVYDRLLNDGRRK